MVSLKSMEKNYQCFLKEAEQGIVDTMPEKGGQGKGIRPHQLLEAALASCMNISLRKKAEEIGVGLANVETFVRINWDHAGKTIFEYGYTGLEELPDKQKEQILAVLEDCPVRKTLSQQLEFREYAEGKYNGIDT